ncbi:MAG: MFS transporter, partial [Actinomycetota bacterium]|nr:MFS transporter [Actinomycetota bacterium]
MAEQVKRLLLASLCSETAEWMLQIALPVLVFQATGSAASTALMMVLGLLPMVLLSPVTGLAADRVHRPRLLLVVCLGQAVVAAPLLADDAMCWVVMALQTSLAAFFEPARNALVADLVPMERRT